MDIGLYFTTIQYMLMFATFAALVMIFLYIYVGREEQKSTEQEPS